MVPASYVEPSLHYLGSTKDIAARVQYYEDRGIEHEILAHGKTAPEILEAMATVSLDNFSHVVLEKASFGPVVRFIRDRAPNTRIYIRGHNAEGQHRLDYVRASLRIPRRRGLSNVASLSRNIWRYGARDIMTARAADGVLSICESDTQHYWRRIVGRRAVTVPFFLSRPYVRAIDRETRRRKLDICLLPGSMHPGPLIEHSLNQFFRLLYGGDLTGLQDDGWQFVISGAKSKGTPLPRPLKEMGVRWRHFGSPYEMLGRARAAMILSDYGRGFKTKILEAILCRALVLCTAGLYRRLPEQTLPYCVPVDPRRPATLAKALERARGEFPGGEPNRLLQRVAYERLDQVFGIA